MGAFLFIWAIALVFAFVIDAIVLWGQFAHDADDVSGICWPSWVTKDEYMPSDARDMFRRTSENIFVASTSPNVEVFSPAFDRSKFGTGLDNWISTCRLLRTKEKRCARSWIGRETPIIRECSVLKVRIDVHRQSICSRISCIQPARSYLPPDIRAFVVGVPKESNSVWYNESAIPGYEGIVSNICGFFCSPGTPCCGFVSADEKINLYHCDKSKNSSKNHQPESVASNDILGALGGRRVIWFFVGFFGAGLVVCLMLLLI